MSSPRFENLELNFDGPAPSLTGARTPVSPPPSLSAAPRAVEARSDAEVPSLRPPVTEPASAAEPKVLSVTQLTRRVRQLLEQRLGAVNVEGEMSNLRLQANGHAYFTLKDEGAQLSCVLFRSSRHAGMPPLADGLKVQALGEISVYEPRGQYQMIVRDLQAAGLGALQMKFEALKRRLAAEGLFEAGRKRPLPAFPRTVALVTSPQGAALRDMLTIFRRRAPWLRLLIFPARVQGDGAAGEIIRALERATGASAAWPRPELVVLARGGGSMEDLWAFNEEALARAIVASPLPVVSAVGHEIDFTIADFAADLRAPTPSAAAELVAPDGPALRQRARQLEQMLAARVQRRLQHARQVLDWHRRGGLVREPRRLIAQAEQQTDLLEAELQRQVKDGVAQARQRVVTAAHALEQHRPVRLAAELRQRCEALRHRLRAALDRQVTAADSRCGQLEAVLRTLGPDRTLARGFSFTCGPDGKPLQRAAEAKKGDRLRTRFTDGEVVSVVE